MEGNSLTRRNFIKLAAFVGTSLKMPQKLAEAGTKSLPSILCISWDGADIRSIITLLRYGELSNLANLYVERLECGGCSKTKPGHVEALTGLDYWTTKIYSNDEFREMPKRYSLFWKIKKAYPHYWCACIFSKGVHTGDGPGEPWANFGDWAKNGGIEYYANNSPILMSSDETNIHLTYAMHQFEYPGLIYCHYKQPDIAGHVKGMDSYLYKERLRELDNFLGWTLSYLNPDITILYSDHGFDNPGEHTHHHAPHGFVASNMPLIANGQRRDIAFTIMDLLSMPMKTYETPLDGKSLLRDKQYLGNWIVVKSQLLKIVNDSK